MLQTKLRIKRDHFTLKREYWWNSHTRRFRMSHGGYNLYWLFSTTGSTAEYCIMRVMTLRWHLVLPKLGIKRDHFTLKWPCLCNSNRKNILLYLEAASMAWLFSTTWSAEMAKNEKDDVVDVWYCIFMGSSPIALLSSGHICPIAILMGSPPSPTAYVQ